MRDDYHSYGLCKSGLLNLVSARESDCEYRLKAPYIQIICGNQNVIVTPIGISVPILA